MIRPQMSRLVVQFGWLVDAHHLGFLLAKEKGYFADSGLDVTLLPGVLDDSPVRALSTGAAEICQLSGAEQLLSAAQEGLPIVAIAAVHRHSPHALISLSSNPIPDVDGLRGKTVGVAYGDTAELLFRELMRQHRIREDEVKVVPFRFDLSPLRQGLMDGVTGFSTDQPFTLRAAGLDPVVLSYSDLGVDEYGYMLATSKAYADQHGAQLRAFISGSRRGWQEVFADPDRALDVLRSTVEGAHPAVEREKITALRRLMLNPDGQLADWTMDQNVVRKTAERMVAFGELKPRPSISSIVDNVIVESAEP